MIPLVLIVWSGLLASSLSLRTLQLLGAVETPTQGDEVEGDEEQDDALADEENDGEAVDDQQEQAERETHPPLRLRSEPDGQGRTEKCEKNVMIAGCIVIVWSIPCVTFFTGTCWFDRLHGPPTCSEA